MKKPLVIGIISVVAIAGIATGIYFYNKDKKGVKLTKEDKAKKDSDVKSQAEAKKETDIQRAAAKDRAKFAQEQRAKQEFVDESKLTDNAKALKARLREQNK